MGPLLDAGAGNDFTGICLRLNTPWVLFAQDAFGDVWRSL